MLRAFERNELEAIVRLRGSEDFKLVFKFIEDAVGQLALDCVNKDSGDESTKLKGASLCFQELRDQIKFAHVVLGRYAERDEIESLERDPISP